MKKILSVALALIMIVSCCTLMVFAGGPYTVTVSVDGPGGKFIDATGKTAFVPLTTTASDSAVPEGSEKIYVIAPDAGYRVKSVKVNGQEAALDHLTLKLSNISGNKDIVIQFETGTKTDQTVVNETFDTGIDNFTSTGTGNISWDEAGKALKVSGASTNFRLIYSPGMEVKTGHKYTITFDITPSITQQNCGAFGIDAGDKGYTFDTLRSSNATNILYNYTSVGTFNNSYTANTKTTFTYDFTVFGIKNNGVQVDSVDTKTIGANVLFINMIKTAGITGFDATIDNFKIVDTSVTAGPPADPTLSISVDGGNGTVKDSGAVVSGDVTVPYGGSKTLTFVPDNGYLIDKVLVNGAPVTLDSKNEYTLTNITENQSIVASFKQKPLNGSYTVSASVNGSGGKVSDVTGKPSGYVPMETSLVNEEVEHGSSRTYIIAPDIGYSIKSIEVNGTVVRPDHYTLTVPNIINDTDIIITFEQQATAEDVVVNETFETGIEGFVRSAGNGVIAWDKTNKALSITNASTNTRFAYTPGLEMKAGHKYTVSFDITTNKAGSGQFGLEASSSTAYYKFDTINAAKPAQLLYNHNATGYKAYTYTPNTKTTFSFDFYFLGIKNGEIQLDSMHSSELGANNLYFNLVKEEGITGFNATIDNFKIVDTSVTAGPPADPTLSISVDGGNGTVKDSGAVVSGDVTVPYGGSKTLTFVPDSGYLVDKVLVNGTPVPLNSENEYTLTNITENQNIVVTFRVPMPPSISSGGAVFVQVDYIDGSDPTLYNSAVIFSTVVLPEGWELTGDYGILFTGGTVTDYKLLSVANIAGKFGIRVFGKGLVPGSYSVKAYAVVKNTISGETMTVYEPEPRSFTIT